MRYFRMFAGAAIVAVMVANVPAQACGGAFNVITINDEKGKTVPAATIEILGPVHRPAGTHYTLDDAGQEAAEPVAAKDVDQSLKNGKDLSPIFFTDFCKNPLRQTLGETKLKYFNHIPNRPESELGYCTIETLDILYLLRATATGYETGYYRGPFLGGCGDSFKFVLARTKKR